LLQLASIHIFQLSIVYTFVLNRHKRSL